MTKQKEECAYCGGTRTVKTYGAPDRYGFNMTKCPFCAEDSLFAKVRQLMNQQKPTLPRIVWQGNAPGYICLLRIVQTKNEGFKISYQGTDDFGNVIWLPLGVENEFEKFIWVQAITDSFEKIERLEHALEIAQQKLTGQ